MNNAISITANPAPFVPNEDFYDELSQVSNSHICKGVFLSRGTSSIKKCLSKFCDLKGTQIQSSISGTFILENRAFSGCKNNNCVEIL